MKLFKSKVFVMVLAMIALSGHWLSAEEKSEKAKELMALLAT